MLAEDSLVQHGQYLPLFNRQRRNLMIASLLLIFAETNELKFIGPLFGFEIIGEIDAAKALAFFLAYFLLRYFQFFLDMGDKNILSTHHLKKIRLAQSKAIEIFMRKYANKPVDHIDEDKIQTKGNHPGIFSDHPWTFIVPWKERIKSGDRFENHEATISLHRVFSPIIWFRAWLSVIFNTRLFTEYVLPFFVSVFAILFYTLKTQNLF